MNEVFLFTIAFIISIKHTLTLIKPNNNQHQLTPPHIPLYNPIDLNEIPIPIDTSYTTATSTHSTTVHITLPFPTPVNSIHIECKPSKSNITISYSLTNTTFHLANTTKHINNPSKHYFITPNTLTRIKHLSITINNTTNTIPCNITLYKLKYTLITISHNVFNNYCLITPNTNKEFTFDNDLPLITAKCNSITDNRHLFLFWHNGYITPLNTPSKCITHDGNSQSHISLQSCIQSLEYNDNRYLWSYDEQNYLLSSPKSTESIYMAITTNNNSEHTSFINKHHIQHVHSSSTLYNYIIENIIDYDDMNAFWLSDISHSALNAVSVVDIEFKFEFRVTLRFIRIHWKFKAMLFKVIALYDESQSKEVELDVKEENDMISIIYMINEREVNGVVLQLLQSETKIRNVDVYGIYKVYFNFKGHYVIKSNECTSKGSCGWDVREVNYKESRRYVLNESYYENSFSFYGNETKKVNAYVDMKVNDIENETKYIDNSINDLHLQLMSYIVNNKEYYYDYYTTDNDDDNELFIAKSCEEIKHTYNRSVNGFYSVMNQCMETPLQLYCDFTHNRDYYLLYIDNDDNDNEDNDIVNMSKHCASVGLEPIDKHGLSKEIVLSIEQFLQMHIPHISTTINNNNNNNFLLHEYIIPLSLYDNITDINSIIIPSNSTIIELNNIFQLHNTNNITNTSNNTFILYYSISPLTNSFTLTYTPYSTTFTSFNHSKLFGYICSTNTHMYYYIHNNITYIHCDTKLNDIHILSFSHNHLFSCPHHCLSWFNSTNPYDVYYNKQHNSYLNTSHICISAIHSGIISAKQGGDFHIRLVKGEYSYDISEHNGVFASHCVNYNNYNGFVIEQHIQECPMLMKQQHSIDNTLLLLNSNKSTNKFKELFYKLENNHNNIKKLWLLLNKAKQLLHTKEEIVKSHTSKTLVQLCKENCSFYETFEFNDIESNYMCYLGNDNNNNNVVKWEYVMLLNKKNKIIRKDSSLDNIGIESYLLIKYVMFVDFKFAVSLSVPKQKFQVENSDAYLRLYFLYENENMYYYYQMNQTSHSIWFLCNEELMLLNITYIYTYDVIEYDKVMNVTVVKKNKEVKVYNGNRCIVEGNIGNGNMKGRLGFGGSVPVVYYYNIEGIFLV